jgi:hypothetical protein
MKIFGVTIEPIEHVEPGKTKWSITIGTLAPWDNFHLPIPGIIGELWCTIRRAIQKSHNRRKNNEQI